MLPYTQHFARIFFIYNIEGVYLQSRIRSHLTVFRRSSQLIKLQKHKPELENRNSSAAQYQYDLLVVNLFNADNACFPKKK